jgi:hypothetical protein
LTFCRAESSDANYLPVTVNVSEAIVLAKVIISRDHLARGKRDSNDAVDLRPEDTSLFYAPFRQENYFYVDSRLGAITFESRSV